MSFLYNNVPIMPGAYLVNGLSTSNNELWQLPIFGSVRNLTSMGFGNVDNFYYVMPGYKIELYRNSEYSALSQTIDNTNGTKIMYKQIVTPSPNPTGIFGDDCNSIKMYYENVEIADKYTYAIYGNNSGSTTTNPTTTLTSGSHKLLNLSLFPGAYIINSPGAGCMAIFFSIAEFNTFSTQSGDKEDCVLVMPGYKIILYSGSNHTYGTYVAIDNTEGTTIIVGLSNGVRDLSDNVTGGWTANNILSCKLFFNGNEVIQTDIAVTQTS
jgi:hypothetical protein